MAFSKSNGYDKNLSTKYSKAQFERLQKSVDYLLPKIERKLSFIDEYGEFIWKDCNKPRLAKRRARELNNIKKALETLKSTEFFQI